MKLRELHQDGATPFYVTTIIEDNLPARRFLEAGIKGLPTYRPLGSLVTLILPVTRKRRVAPGFTVNRCKSKDLDKIVDCLQRHGTRYQFAPHWKREDLVSPREPGTCASTISTAFIPGTDWWVVWHGGISGPSSRWWSRGMTARSVCFDRGSTWRALC